MLTKIIRFGIKLNSLVHNFDRTRNLVVHHGLMGSCKNFRTLSKQPSFSKYVNSHLIDARNHGSSPHTPTHTIPELADDLYQYITAKEILSPHQRLTLMGHSMGAMAIMEFTKRYDAPEIQQLIDRIIIIDIPATSIISRKSYGATGTMLKKLVQINMSLPLTQINQEIEKCATTKDVAALLKTDVIMGEDGRHKWKVNMEVLANAGYKNIGEYDLRHDNPGQWRTPIEIIYGQFSEYFDEEQYNIYRKYYPQLKEQNCHKIDRANHWVHFDNAQLFLKKMQTILAKDQPGSF